MPRLFGVLLAVSLGLPTMAATLWLRSHLSEDLLTLGWYAGEDGSASFFGVDSRVGLTMVYWYPKSEMRAMGFVPNTVIAEEPRWRWTTMPAHWSDPPGLATSWRAYWFAVYRNNVGGQHGIYVQLPDWALTVLASIPASGWLAQKMFRRVRRSRLEMTGRCVACGYDLRASAEKCPECGTRIPTSRSGRI
jgi:hypothetical protein